MSVPPILSYDPGDRLKLHLNGVSSLKKRKLNFPADSGITITENDSLNRFDIKLGNITDKTKLPPTTMFSDRVSTLTVPLEWAYVDLGTLLPTSALRRRIGFDTDGILKIIDNNGVKKFVDSSRPDNRKSGYLYCTQINEIGTGFFEGHLTENVSGTINKEFDSIHGSYIRQTTQAATNAIVRRSIGSVFTRPEWNPSCKVKFRVPDSGSSNDQIFVGFANKTLLNTTANPLSNADHGVMAGADNTDNTWDVYTGNGSTAAAVNIGPTRDAGWNTLEISATANGTKWVINLNEGAAISVVTAGIPSTTENMYFHCEFQVKSAAGKSLDTAYLMVHSDH